jgi:hypothetical protein
MPALLRHSLLQCSPRTLLVPLRLLDLRLLVQLILKGRELCLQSRHLRTLYTLLLLLLLLVLVLLVLVL